MVWATLYTPFPTESRYIFKGFVEKLAKEKGRNEDFALYSMIETMAPQIIAGERAIYKGVSANVDFYSGFVYSMLDIPT